MRSPRGLDQKIVPNIGGAYNWLTPDTQTKYAETAIKMSCQANSLFPGSFQLQHWAKSRIHDKMQALAQLNIGPDPMGMMTGNTGLVCSGKLGYLVQIPDVNQKKPMPGMPEKISGTTVRASLDSEFNVDTTVEMRSAEMPISLGVRAKYNLNKDDLKLGLLARGFLKFFWLGFECFPVVILRNQKMLSKTTFSIDQLW